VSLSARPNRHDIGSAPFAKLSDRSLERSRKQAGSSLFNRNFVLSAFRHNEDKLAANFNCGRGAPEIASTHTRSFPVVSIRLREYKALQHLTGGLTKVNPRVSDPAGRTLPHIRSAGSFSIALET
jgi:hypothetical protein